MYVSKFGNIAKKQMYLTIACATGIDYGLIEAFFAKARKNLTDTEIVIGSFLLSRFELDNFLVMLYKLAFASLEACKKGNCPPNVLPSDIFSAMLKIALDNPIERLRLLMSSKLGVREIIAKKQTWNSADGETVMLLELINDCLKKMN